MRVLIVHNAYQQRGGEDSVVEAERELLAVHGHDVSLYSRHNDELSGIAPGNALRQLFWSDRTFSDLGALQGNRRFEVIHVHNTFPLISPSVYWLAAKFRVPVVQTLHNFRLHCPQAMYLRNGAVCEECLGRIPWRGAVRCCYRDSFLQSSALAGMVTLHRALGTWRSKVTRYIALNEFCRNKFIEGGLPAERIVVKPNFVDFPAPQVVDRDGFLFVGRLSPEKGIRTLVQAAREMKHGQVAVAGTGPDAGLLDGVASMQALGALSGDEVRIRMAKFMALVLPSIWYENFPRTLVEAFACGLPVIASRIGALAELVEEGVTGLMFEPGDAAGLEQKMRWAQAHPQEMARMGRAARAHYEANFTAERNYRQLIAIYGEAIAEGKGRAA